MKINKYKKIGVVAILLTIIFSMVSPFIVEATSNVKLVREKIPNAWYTRRGGGKPYMSAQYETYTINGKTVYCIEPGVDIHTDAYLSYDGLQSSPYDTATNKKIELIGHYGYDYPGHHTLRYRMATQSLIWETVGGQIVEFWTKASGWGDFINLDAERNEIMRLVNSHYNKPSFNGQSVQSVIGKEYVITDTNNVLGEYEIFRTENMKARIEGNKIYVTPTNVGTQTLSVVRKHYDNYTTIVYKGNGVTTQKMGYFRFTDPVVASVKFESLGGDVALQKIDNDTQKGLPQGVEATLGGAEYGIYDLSDNLISKIITNEKGIAKSDILPDTGTFYLKEIKPSKGYLLDSTKYYFEIKADDLHPNLKVYEQIIKRDVEINKYFAKGETGMLIPEENIEFGVYDSKQNLVSKIKTNEQGVAKINLVYGTYTVKQITTTPGHEKVKDFVIKVNNESPKLIKYSLSNAPITAKLKLVKIDSESKKVIPYSGVTFKIKNVDTGKYVSQKVSYPEKAEITEFKTDENGEFMTAYPLVSGTYQVEEIKAPNGYLINKEPVVFRIDGKSNFIDDNEFGKYIKVEFSDDKIMGEIQLEKIGEKFVIKNNEFKYENINLKDVEFGLYAREDIVTLDGVKHFSKNDLVGKVKTNSEGKATFKNLYLGKYYIKELKQLNGYVENTKEYDVELNSKDNIKPIVGEFVKINNILVKGNLEFTKTDLINGEPLANTIIEIYTEKDELIFTGKTDENGKINIKELKAGKYYIIEKEAPTGYVITDEKIIFEIKNNGEIVKAKMKNKPIQGKLEFTKTDISTGEVLPNTTIEIYTEKDELIFTGKTDENGKIIIDELKYGKYYILEKEAPAGYILNEEKMPFEIKVDGEIVKANMVNEKVIIDVPITGIQKKYIAEIIGSLLVISGIGVIVYVKKKHKQK